MSGNLSQILLVPDVYRVPLREPSLPRLCSEKQGPVLSLGPLNPPSISRCPPPPTPTLPGLWPRPREEPGARNTHKHPLAFFSPLKLLGWVATLSLLSSSCVVENRLFVFLLPRYCLRVNVMSSSLRIWLLRIKAKCVECRKLFFSSGVVPLTPIFCYSKAFCCCCCSSLYLSSS